MAKVTEEQVTGTKIVVELDENEAADLSSLLYRGVGGTTIDELHLSDLMNKLLDANLPSRGAHYFVSTAQL